MSRRNYEQITGWLSPRWGMKSRLKQIHAMDHRLSESRIVEDALLMYVPILERQVLPIQDKSRDQQAVA